MNAVIGIGNLLRADDGVGIHVVQRLEDEITGCEAVDMATAGIDLLGTSEAARRSSSSTLSSQARSRAPSTESPPTR